MIIITNHSPFVLFINLNHRVLSDYTSKRLDLNDPNVYRDLSKPMGALGEERSQMFQDRYRNWEDPSGVIPKFHYGTHYSSAATVIYYLIRLEPFTRFALQLQNGKFDHADRLFFDLNHTWISASSQGGMSFIPELIPEFYYLPDFLINQNKFNLGEHQRGGWCGDVKLPPWCNNDPRIFVRLNRRALESRYVSEHLNEWIDLIFGYKQKGKHAVKSQNVFYYLTYEDVVDVNQIEDPVEKAATIDQINNFGQTPKQLFHKPHPKRNINYNLNNANNPNKETSTTINPNSNPSNSSNDSVKLVTISSHPNLLHPAPSSVPIPQFTKRIHSIYWQGKGDKLHVLDENKVIFGSRLTKYMSYGYSDHSLRFNVLQASTRHRIMNECVAIHERLHQGQITCAIVTDDSHYIITAGEDCVINIYTMHNKYKYRQLTLAKSLYGHYGTITCLSSSSSYSILVSGGNDCNVIIWDLNRLILTKMLPRHPQPITAIAINNLTGDIVTAAGPYLYVWTVNGELAAERCVSLQQSESIDCITFSCGPDYADDNCIITGHRDGVIRFWTCEVPYLDSQISLNKDNNLGFSLVESTSAFNSSALNTGSNSPKDPFNLSSLTSPTANNVNTASRSSPSNSPTLASTNLVPPSSTNSGRARFDTLALDPNKRAINANPIEMKSNSMGSPFLWLDLRHLIDDGHYVGITALHTSLYDYRRLWSGDRSGRVIAWDIQSPEHWMQDSEVRACVSCQTKFTIVERRHHCR
jgi:WD40 repeat protein